MYMHISVCVFFIYIALLKLSWLLAQTGKNGEWLSSVMDVSSPMEV